MVQPLSTIGFINCEMGVEYLTGGALKPEVGLRKLENLFQAFEKSCGSPWNYP